MQRYTAIWEFWDKAKADDEAFMAFEEELKRQRGGFAESTLEATKWLTKFHPERLENWYEQHLGLKEYVLGGGKIR